MRLYASLSDDECKSVREYYYKNIFPLVTPQAMDPAHPFPFVSNLSLNLLVTARYQNDSDPLMARVKVPIGFGIPRFIRVGKQNDFVRLEDVVANNLDLLFPSMLIDSYELFRVTRNANTERDEDEADDLLALIESELRDRRFAPIVRLEVMTGINPVHRGMLAAELDWTSAPTCSKSTGCCRCATWPSWRRSTRRRCTIRRIIRSIIRASPSGAASSTSFAMRVRSCCCIRTNRSRPRSSGFCAKPPRIRKSARSR